MASAWPSIWPGSRRPWRKAATSCEAGPGDAPWTLDHLVGERKHIIGNVDAERFCRFDVFTFSRCKITIRSLCSWSCSHRWLTIKSVGDGQLSATDQKCRYFCRYLGFPYK